jgi:putative intracellular protease/amidase
MRAHLNESLEIAMKKSTVHLFVFDTMADWEPAFAMAGIHTPEWQLEPDRYQVRTASVDGKIITTMGGIRIQPDLTLNEVTPEDSALLILPGGLSWEGGGNLESIRVAREFLAAGVPVAAICAATLALARAGLLDDRQHTSNAKQYLSSSGYRGGDFYREAPAVTDRNVITAGGAAPVDFAYEIFKILNLYSDAALEAWHALFKNGDASRYYQLASASNQGA